MRKHWLLLSANFLFGLFLQAQSPTQTIKGVVIDKDSRRPLAGASIIIAEDSISTGTITDSSGNFTLSRVPVGRRRIQCTYTGYEIYVTDNILLNSAKEQLLEIEMEQHYLQQSEVIVRSARNPKQPVNKLSIVSTRSFTPEETQRYAASVNDPSRMAMSFPGVQPIRDARSDIIIRGNSAIGVLWRLEGIDIPNPNHFARKGSSGGGITIFSSSVLDNSDFSTGGFAAEYGDAISGVFDMHFRKGNNEKTQYTFKAGLIGIDFSSEGPFKKEQSSYLLNYRYSTLGILNSLGFHLSGERENNKFQDLSFNLNFPSKNNKSVFNFWGIGGLSKENYTELPDVTKWDEYDDYAIYDFETNMGAMGLGHSLQTGKNGVLKTSLAIMGQKVTFVDDTLNTQKIPYTVNDELYKNNRVSIAISYNTKIGSSVTWKTGAYASRIGYTFRQSLFDFDAAVFRNHIVDGAGNTWLSQYYTEFSGRAGKKVTINAGLHYIYLSLNKTSSLEPRAGFQYRINPNHKLSFAVGLHGQTLPLGSYFFKSSNGTFPNLSLDLIKSAHFIAGYNWLMKKNWRLQGEIYLQKLSKVPVVNDINRTFWLLNMNEGYANEALVSAGKGSNKGVDLTMEKFFSKSWFLLMGFSVFNSTYQPLNGKTYSTQYNSHTAGSVTAGKEWKWKRNKTFEAGFKMLYNGGKPISPLLVGAAVNSRKPVLDETRPFSERVSPYFRTDGKLSLRKDWKKTSWILSLDVQNVFGIKNMDALGRRYDSDAHQWIYKKLSGFVPVISYQLDF